MYNPLHPFTAPLLDAFVKSGKVYFVRNTFPRAFDHFDEGVKGYFLITHYDDRSKAMAHYDAIGHDKHRYFYEYSNPGHLEKLKVAASQPTGYRIYSAVFVEDWEKHITKELKEKVNRYMYRHTKWKPGRGEKTSLNFYFQFGQLYFSLSYDGDKISGTFDSLEKG